MRIKDAKTQESSRRAQGLLTLPPQNPPISNLTWSCRRLISIDRIAMSGHFPVFRVSREFHDLKPSILRVLYFEYSKSSLLRHRHSTLCGTRNQQPHGEVATWRSSSTERRSICRSLIRVEAQTTLDIGQGQLGKTPSPPLLV